MGHNDIPIFPCLRMQALCLAHVELFIIPEHSIKVQTSLLLRHFFMPESFILHETKSLFFLHDSDERGWSFLEKFSIDNLIYLFGFGEPPLYFNSKTQALSCTC